TRRLYWTRRGVERLHAGGVASVACWIIDSRNRTRRNQSLEIAFARWRARGRLRLCTKANPPNGRTGTFRCRHHQASAGGALISQLANAANAHRTPPGFSRWYFNFTARERDYLVVACVAIKLKYHRLKPGGV